MYKLFKPIKIMDAVFILRISDNAVIPQDRDNTDYQAYLKWLEEGNTPEQAD
jgi:hypothetical protein